MSKKGREIRGVMKSLIPTITMLKAGDTIDRTVNFMVESNPQSDNAACTFNGSSEIGMAFETAKQNDGEWTITVKKVPPPTSTNPDVKVTIADTSIELATHCRIWSMLDHLPSKVTVTAHHVDNTKTVMGVIDPKLVWEPSGENKMLVAMLKFDPERKPLIAIKGYTFAFEAGEGVKVFPSGVGTTAIHIYRLSLMREIVYETDKETSDRKKQEDTISGPCPAMNFTTDPNDSKTLADMTTRMGETMENTQCDAVLENMFKTYAAGTLTNNTTANAQSSASTSATVSGSASVGWTGGNVQSAGTATGDVQGSVSGTNNLDTAMQASAGNDTRKREQGCEAVVAMTQLMANAQREATCMMTTLNNSMKAQINIDQTIEFDAGNISGSNVTITNSSNTKMIVNFANSNEIDSALTSIMSTMMDSVVDVKNGMTAEGAFAPTVSSKVFGANATTSISEANRQFCNTVVTDQLASIRKNQTIRFTAKDITDSVVTIANESSVEFLAGMMVQNVVKQVMESSHMSDLKAKWKIDNSAASKGLSFDFMGMLLAPLLVVGCIGLFFVVGGPMLLKKFASKYLVLFATAVLVGSVVGMILSSSIGGYAASGLGIACSLYLYFVAWKAFRAGALPTDDKQLPMADSSLLEKIVEKTADTL